MSNPSLTSNELSTAGDIASYSFSPDDTIVAQATPPGKGGVGIVRVPVVVKPKSDSPNALLGHCPKPRYADLYRV